MPMPLRDAAMASALTPGRMAPVICGRRAQLWTFAVAGLGVAKAKGRWVR
jgi:hypothetical protein